MEYSFHTFPTGSKPNIFDSFFTLSVSPAIATVVNFPVLVLSKVKTPYFAFDMYKRFSRIF